MAEKFDLHILGCGSALPTLRHQPTAQVLDIRDKRYMIDCGEGAQLAMRRAKLGFSTLRHIFISHLHGDHCFGLPGLISTCGMLGRTSELHLYGPQDLEATLRPMLDYYCRDLAFDVVFHTVDTQTHALVFEDRSVAVYTLPLRHRVPACGYLFREKPLLPHIRRDMIDRLGIPHYAINGIKQGESWTTPEGKTYSHEELITPADAPRSYAYMSDTAFVPELADLVQGVDLLFHEATFAEQDAVRARQTFHSTAAEAADMARRAEARRLLIGHFSARYDDEAQLLAEARRIFPDTLLAAEGLKIEI